MVMFCDNVCENGYVVKVVVLGLVQVCDLQLVVWIGENVIFLCIMVDCIVLVVMLEILQEIVDQLGVYDLCVIVCELFCQWVIEDNFVNGCLDWDKVGVQFVVDVVLFEMMKLCMLNGSYFFLVYFGYFGGYEIIVDIMINLDYCKVVFVLMMQE